MQQNNRHWKNNMPKWYYDLEALKSTPSVVGGMEYSTEQRYRKEGARFIINVGTRMGLSSDTLATAGKVEETPKKCKDIIKTARTHLTPRQFSQFGNDPKEEVMTLERILLQTIKFDLQVDHPYKYLLKYAKSLKGDKEKLQDMVQMAWTFINDSLCTTLCLQWEPEIIGIAFMYLAGKFTKFEITDWDGRTAQHKYWWDTFVENMNASFLEDICHQFLDNYGFQDPETPCDSPSSPVTKKLKRRHSSSRRNSAESSRHSKSKYNSKMLLNGTSTANSEFVPSEISAPPLPPSHEVPVSSEVPSTTLSLQNSSVTTSVASKVATSSTVSATNTHSSAVHAVSNINMHCNQIHQQELGQVCSVNQVHPAVTNGQQASALPTTQAFPLSVPPPLCNNQRVGIYPQQHVESEKFRNQSHNPCLASSAFSGIFPHLTYQQPQSQFYQQPGHQEHYYNTHHASNQQNTYIPPAQLPIPPSFPIGQSLPPPPQLLPHMVSIPPPTMQPPLPVQFVSQPSQNHVQYCANGHSSTMPFPLLQKQISSNSLRFPQLGQGISPILPANGCV